MSYPNKKKEDFGENESLPWEKKGFVKPLLIGTGVFALRKEKTERMKEKISNAASLWFQLTRLDCRAIFWLQITISYLPKVNMYVCVYFTLAMDFEVFQFPAFSHFRKMAQKRNSVDSAL